MICKSELTPEKVGDAVETIAAFCYFNRCDTCPMWQYQEGKENKLPVCAFLTHIPSEYKSVWIEGLMA